MTNVIFLRSANAYREPPRYMQSDARKRLAGHDLAIETALAEVSRLETRIAELRDEGADESNPKSELSLALMRFNGLPHSIRWHLEKSRELRKCLGIGPHALDLVPLAAE